VELFIYPYQIPNKPNVNQTDLIYPKLTCHQNEFY